MDITILIAKILGVYLIVSGMFLILRAKTLPVLLKDFFQHEATVFLSGAILLFLGGVLAFRGSLVPQYVTTQASWVTVLGWLIMLKGAAYMLIPQKMMHWTMKKMQGPMKLLGLIAVAVGVMLFWTF